MSTSTFLTTTAFLVSNIVLNLCKAGHSGGLGGSGGSGGPGGPGGNYNSNDDEVMAVELAGGSCLYNEDYYYFIRPGNPKYVAIIFSGGGFCYTEENCPSSQVIDPDSFSQIRPDLIYGAPFNNNDGIKWTVIVLPQCSEDFHLGFQPLYSEGPFDNRTGLPDCTTVWCASFMGANNINLFLFEIKNYINFNKIKHLTLYGVSSGTIGATAWGFTIFDLVSPNALKTLVLDGWAIGQDIQLSLVNVISFIYNAVNSPFLVPELVDALNTLTLTKLVELLQKKYCELFVSSLYFEFDSNQKPIYAALTGNIEWITNPQVWLTHMTNTILPEASTYAPKRSSYYVSKGDNHVFMFPEFDVDINDISTECDEDQTAQEYLTDVIGGKKDVKMYYGQPEQRVKTFPKYSYNNIEPNCIQCNDTDNF